MLRESNGIFSFINFKVFLLILGLRDLVYIFFIDRYFKSFLYVYYRNECSFLESGRILVVNEKGFYFFFFEVN